MMKRKLFLLWLIFLLSFSLLSCSTYEDRLERARDNKKLISEKRKKEKKLHKQTFEYYKQAYEIDSSLFGKYDLYALGNMYERFENNKWMKEQLYKLGESTPRK